jgi:hypothetical protein
LETKTSSPFGGSTTVFLSDNLDLQKAFQGKQITVSENHPSWKARQTGTFKGDLGGPFSSVSRRTESFDSGRVLTGTSYNAQTLTTTSTRYWGPFLPAPYSLLAFPPDPSSSLNSLRQKGTVAISRCSPTNPTADLSVAFGEAIKDGIPSLVGGTLKKFRDMSNQDRRRVLGKEYLNVEFGWKPLLNDLNKTFKAVMDADAVWQQYVRDSGKVVRRRYEFPVVEEPVQTTVFRSDCSPWTSPSGGALNDPLLLNKGQVIRSLSVTRRQWFSGAFTYYVPPADGSLRTDIAREIQQLRKLLGVSLTPDALWNLAPWSWAVDWFTNTSETLRNWSSWAIDNLVMVYGYMMEHSIAKYTYTFVGPTGFRSAGVRPPDITMTVESKVRIQATPYGFGLDSNSFSSRQKAIVAALGISRSK